MNTTCKKGFLKNVFQLKSEWTVEACQGCNMQHVSMIIHAVKQKC